MSPVFVNSFSTFEELLPQLPDKMLSVWALVKRKTIENNINITKLILTLYALVRIVYKTSN